MLLRTGDTGCLQEVKRLDHNKPFKTLGIHKTVLGDETAQITEMKGKSDTYTRGTLLSTPTHAHLHGGRPTSLTAAITSSNVTHNIPCNTNIYQQPFA